MFRFRHMLFAASLLSFAIVGCDEESQPNKSAAPEEVNADFAKKSADMMRAANGDMGKKALKDMGPNGLGKTPAPAAAAPAPAN